MADQASVRSNPGQPPAPPANGTGVGIVGSVAEFGNDLVTLAELQARLAALDLKDTTARATWPLIAALGSAAVVLSALTVGMFGVAELLARLTGLSSGLALVLTAFLGFLVAGGVAFVSSLELKQSLNTFRRSQEELTRNLTWVRTVLVQSSRSTPKRG